MKYFDLHCDTLCRCVDEKKSLEKNDFHIDIARLSLFDKATQVFACFIDDKYSGESIQGYSLQLTQLIEASLVSWMPTISP